jgi:hypothetical protein
MLETQIIKCIKNFGNLFLFANLFIFHFIYPVIVYLYFVNEEKIFRTEYLLLGYIPCFLDFSIFLEKKYNLIKYILLFIISTGYLFFRTITFSVFEESLYKNVMMCLISAEWFSYFYVYFTYFIYSLLEIRQNLELV